ncbi:unnamed protein product [Arctia plantaginis]|uniref:Uncharacterized protein n=1 Tax=Arctia plantaginis TaxID=874455 RepID=A0A8S1AIN7_ARCPL|nr:unnamed protein product [Arctia plantaginis]
MTEMLVAQRQPTKLEFDLTGMIVEETDDKLKDLLSTQEANFKALGRAMSKVDIEVLKENWEAGDKLHWQLETTLKGSSLKTNYESRFEDLEQKYDNLRRLLNRKNWSNIHNQR